METLLLFLLSQLVVYGDVVGDPAHAGWEGRQQLRQFECERLSQAEAHERYPGRVPPPHSRATALMQIDALVCGRHVAPDGRREARDEAILQRLEEDIAELSGLATTAVDDEDTTWVVDAYYPHPAIVRKIATASRVELAERGNRVSDQAPLLTAGDVEVLRTMPLQKALPVACRRLFQTGAFGDDVTFLSLALLHPQESQLHAGVCRRGRFRWLR